MTKAENHNRDSPGLPFRYRPEIDGLRAVAVIPVILFHAGFEAFGGGYIGVDVFFVISGYLITSIIISEVDQGTFSLLKFYERRARRILPALMLMMLVCIPIAWISMLPEPLENFGQSVVATTLFANNILLSVTAGYWDLSAEFKPLLHTWSLAVEEQYYVIFPLVLLAFLPFGKKWTIAVLAAAFVLSLGAAHWGSQNYPNATFYNLPTRGWEILLGAFIAFYFSKKCRPVAGARSEVLSLLGMAAIAYAAFSYDEHTPFPSLWTLIPVMGTGLVILYAHKGTTVCRILSSGLLVGIGLVSYSAYLWHQPLLSFARIWSVGELSTGDILLLLAVLSVVSVMSWKIVEVPFRNKTSWSARGVLYSGAVASAVLLSLGSSIHLTNGFPERIYDKQTAKSGDMYIEFNERVFGYKKDQFAQPEATRVLVLGDSFGRDVVNIIVENFDTSKLELVYRDDLGDCLRSWAGLDARNLYDQAHVLTFANASPRRDCVSENVGTAEADGKEIFYVGTKHFGPNLNWLARLDPEERRSQWNPILPAILADEKHLAGVVPPRNYISIIDKIVVEGRVPITDAEGRLLSADRTHLTRYGALYLGRAAVLGSRLGTILTADHVATAFPQ